MPSRRPSLGKLGTSVPSGIKGRPQRIGAVIPSVLKRAQRQHAALADVQQRWGTMVGRRLAAHTKPVSLRQGRLIVRVDQPGDGFALSYQREQVLRALHDATKGTVTELVIRPG